MNIKGNEFCMLARIVRIVKLITRVNFLKTIYINFRCFPLRKAVYLPLLIGWNTKVKIKGLLIVKGPIKPGMIKLSIGGSKDLIKYENTKSYVSIDKHSTLCFTGKANFSKHISIVMDHANVTIGDNFNCNYGCRISSLKQLIIGDDVLLGGNVVIRDSDGHTIFNLDEPTLLHENKETITIGNHVWIANESSILKGANIPNNCVVGYSSICTRNILQENSLIAGCPARVVKTNINWKY